MGLTPKQEHFCKLIVSGKDGKEAYTIAYDIKANDRTRITEANKLLCRDDITARIKELNKPLQNHITNMGISARQKQIEFIQSRIEHCLSVDDEQSVIRYTDMLNKINALYKETETIEEKENNVSNLDITTLKKLTGTA